MLDLSEVKWLLQRVPAWARVLGTSQHLPICHPSSLTERCRMALVWVPATRLTLLEGTAGQAGPVVSDQSNKNRQVYPQRSQFFHTELLHWKDYSEVEHRYNRHTDNKSLHGMSTKLLLPLFAAALQGSDSLAQSRTPIHPRASEVRPSEGSMLENYFRFSHYSAALQRSHFPYLKGTWCC